MERHIYLIGFMGTGKSTVSRALKNKLHVKEFEMDAELVKDAGMTINEIFQKHGEAYFRDLETEMIKKIAAYVPCVVSCGGGAVLRAENVELMKQSGMIVLLTARPETVFLRVKNSKDRPILNGHMDVDYIASLMEKRSAVYESACDVKITTDGKKPEQIAAEILKFYNL